MLLLQWIVGVEPKRHQNQVSARKWFINTIFSCWGFHVCSSNKIIIYYIFVAHKHVQLKTVKAVRLALYSKADIWSCRLFSTKNQSSVNASPSHYLVKSLPFSIWNWFRFLSRCPLHPWCHEIYINRHSQKSLILQYISTLSIVINRTSFADIDRSWLSVLIPVLVVHMQLLM